MSRRRGRLATLLGFALLAILAGVPLPAMPSFPGTLAGGATGIAAAFFLVLSAAYAVLKPALLRTRAGRWLSPAAASQLHVWAGTLAAALALLHSGLALRSPLGSALVLLVGTSVISGAVGRFHLRRLAGEITSEDADLAGLRAGSAQVPIGAERQVVRAIADLESTRDILTLASRGLRAWIAVHIVASILAVGLVAVHVWSALHLGVRWWP